MRSRLAVAWVVVVLLSIGCGDSGTADKTISLEIGTAFWECDLDSNTYGALTAPSGHTFLGFGVTISDRREVGAPVSASPMFFFVTWEGGKTIAATEGVTKFARDPCTSATLLSPGGSVACDVIFDTTAATDGIPVRLGFSPHVDIAVTDAIEPFRQPLACP